MKTREIESKDSFENFCIKIGISVKNNGYFKSGKRIKGIKLHSLKCRYKNSLNKNN